MAQAIEQQRVFKYPLSIVNRQVVEMPKWVSILKVAFQDGQLCMWCQVTPSYQKITYPIYIVGTGYPLPHIALNYLETVADKRGLVWHIYLGAD